MKVKLYRLVVIALIAANEVECLMLTDFHFYNNSSSIIKTISFMLTTVWDVLMSIMFRDIAESSYLMAAHAWTYNKEPAITVYALNMMKVCRFFKRHFADRSRKYWTAAAKLRRSIEKGDSR